MPEAGRVVREAAHAVGEDRIHVRHRDQRRGVARAEIPREREHAVHVDAAVERDLRGFLDRRTVRERIGERDPELDRDRSRFGHRIEQTRAHRAIRVARGQKRHEARAPFGTQAPQRRFECRQSARQLRDGSPGSPVLPYGA
jgi:hypothetical protein